MAQRQLSTFLSNGVPRYAFWRARAMSRRSPSDTPSDQTPRDLDDVDRLRLLTAKGVGRAGQAHRVEERIGGNVN
ncbi:hypothetical protein [Mycolicibacterium lacusdiani]|uniref:hypothetical protein n=1 Tax=Mycolicibacterium lacusdiani TaxID=2895283 RepID=UPI001F422196|nr:hypothetical protein [Mycolicibacterium lacusdiani]